MPYSEPSVHHVTQISVEALDEPACLTMTFMQAIPVGTNTVHRDDASMSVHLSKDQDGADAYMMASAILAAQSSYDSEDQRRVRAAICLGWRPVADPKSGEIVQWERPWREGDVLKDDPMYVGTPYQACLYDLGFLE